jgi:hypothetical protein
MTESVILSTESGTFGCSSFTRTIDAGRFSWSCDGGWSSSLWGVLRNRRIGAPRSGTRLMRRLGAGVTSCCTLSGVFDADPLRDIFNLGFLRSGDMASLFCASRAVVRAQQPLRSGDSGASLYRIGRGYLASECCCSVSCAYIRPGGEAAVRCRDAGDGSSCEVVGVRDRCGVRVAVAGQQPCKHA